MLSRLTGRIIKESVASGSRLMNKILVLGHIVNEERVIGFCSSKGRYGGISCLVVCNNAADIDSRSYTHDVSMDTQIS